MADDVAALCAVCGCEMGEHEFRGTHFDWSMCVDALRTALQAIAAERDALKVEIAERDEDWRRRLFTRRQLHRAAVEEAQEAKNALTALEERAKKAEADAERYRWLFDGGGGRYAKVWREWSGEDDFRNAIDAAIAHEGKI